MGYYAEGNGTIKFKNSVNKNIISNAMTFAKDAFEDFAFYERDGEDGIHYIDIDFVDYHWHSEDMDDFFNMLYEILIDADIYMRGEGDCYWKYKFNPNTRSMDDLYGTVIYSDSNDFDFLPDENLIKELEARGYVVEKKEE